MNEEANFIATALAAGMRAADIQTIDDTPIVVVPGDTKVVDLENLMRTPTRKRGTVNANSVAGFVAYFKKHYKDGQTNLYMDLAAKWFIAIFDDDTLDAAGWRQHRLHYACPLSPEWTRWSGSDGRQRTQEEFANFIEANLPDIIEPDSATILEISRSLEAKKNVEFSQGIRLDNGQVELKYLETIEGSAAKGQMRIPEQFRIGIPVFLGRPVYGVTCRLRYRIPKDHGCGLLMWFEMERPHKVVEDAFDQIVHEIEAETGIAPIDAKPAFLPEEKP